MSPFANNFVIDMRTTRLGADYSPAVVRGCTANAVLGSTCDFAITVTGSDNVTAVSLLYCAICTSRKLQGQTALRFSIFLPTAS